MWNFEIFHLYNSNFALLRIIQILLSMGEEKEFAIGRSLQRIFDQIPISSTHLDKFDHLAGLFGQEDLDELPISAKQVAVLLSIFIEIRNESGIRKTFKPIAGCPRPLNFYLLNVL